MKKIALVLVSLISLAACSDVGSESWCNEMKEKPKNEWSAQSAVDYAKFCIFQSQIGSTAWCKDMEDKPKGDWTANEAGDFAKHCIF
ncbi:DUF3012 domain-containing protein [Vibrio aestuarianus]|uniref:DUF3012 domain-containing protein n=1 Tax=Vibrio aestuarianus TaxID=28171 RepID=UPI00144569D5|nr:DUF3012 domain-containing protein [Vibrio aestuarianus]NKZ47456.1 DUF3012 domain-containing protein [Vibrio aestuarianus subsp. francensis]NLS51266.1 DUF3012 domain-containing protein [Vibrio aestuarianus subsp. francensis]CAH8220459.1 conserved exported hypothetical protein [Vibrio aestuarianus subsp. francensis]CAH8222014.1 conserved exported hypothetical protein [Vibrio aestuarianus]